jgi:hypothetical protein
VNGPAIQEMWLASLTPEERAEALAELENAAEIVNDDTKEEER